MAGPFDALLAKAKAPPADEPMMAPEPDDETDDPRRAAVLPAADDLLAAIQAKDSGGIADAMLAMIEAAKGEGESTPESEEA